MLVDPSGTQVEDPAVMWGAVQYVNHKTGKTFQIHDEPVQFENSDSPAPVTAKRPPPKQPPQKTPPPKPKVDPPPPPAPAKPPQAPTPPPPSAKAEDKSWTQSEWAQGVGGFLMGVGAANIPLVGPMIAPVGVGSAC